MGKGKGSYYESGFQQLQESQSGLCCGPCLVVLSIVLIGYNELSNISTWRDIQEARDSKIEVECTTTFDSAGGKVADGDLVYVGPGCEVKGTATLTDSVTGMTSKDADANLMRRSFSMNLWQQRCTTTKTGNGGKKTSCTYSEGVTSTWPTFNSKDSESQKYTNYNEKFKLLWTKLSTDATSPNYCTSAQFTDKANGISHTCVTDGTMVGAFGLPKEAVTKLESDTKSPMEKTTSSNVALLDPDKKFFMIDETRFILQSGSSWCATDSTNAACEMGLGKTTVSWKVTKFKSVSAMGTLRVLKSANPPQLSLVTVVSKRSGGKSQTYVALGKATGDDLLDSAESANSAVTWVLRFFCFLLIWCGIIIFFTPAVKFVSLFHDCFGEMLEKLITILACPPACCCTLTMIAIFWVTFRPMVAIPMLLVACACGGGSAYFAYSNQQQKRNAAAQQKQGYAPQQPAAVQQPPAVQQPQATAPAEGGYGQQSYGNPQQPAQYPPQQPAPAQYPPQQPQQGYPPQQPAQNPPQQPAGGYGARTYDSTA